MGRLVLIAPHKNGEASTHIYIYIYIYIYNWSRSAYENLCQCCLTPIDRSFRILVQITQFSFVYSPPPPGFRGNAWNYRLLFASIKMRQNLNERPNIILACWWQLFNRKVVSQSPSAFHKCFPIYTTSVQCWLLPWHHSINISWEGRDHPRTHNRGSIHCSIR